MVIYFLQLEQTLNPIRYHLKSNKNMLLQRSLHQKGPLCYHYYIFMVRSSSLAI